MKSYKILTFEVENPVYIEVLIAELGYLGYEGFEENDQGLKAYIETMYFDESIVLQLISRYAGQVKIDLLHIEDMEEQNWNELWESNFDPVMVENKILIKAPFHQIDQEFTYEIVIEPKMAFGTGHHETTYLVLKRMLDIDFQDKTVLDFGCGTGILAMMASLLGAKSILAIDNDPWSYQNTLENTEVNQIRNVTAILGDQKDIIDKHFDVIIANINVPVLLNTLDIISNSLNHSNLVVLSGILHTDAESIEQRAKECSLVHLDTFQRNDWVVMTFKK
ncbi:MAG: 50S ribosomal protein L11 methyltransferase [Chitinophagales bacterium]